MKNHLELGIIREDLEKMSRKQLIERLKWAKEDVEHWRDVAEKRKQDLDEAHSTYERVIRTIAGRE